MAAGKRPDLADRGAPVEGAAVPRKELPHGVDGIPHVHEDLVKLAPPPRVSNRSPTRRCCAELPSLRRSAAGRGGQEPDGGRERAKVRWERWKVQL